MILFQKEYDNSLDNSSLVNKAYKTLRDPYQRGVYILELMADSIDQHDSQTGDFDFTLIALSVGFA